MARTKPRVSKKYLKTIQKIKNCVAETLASGVSPKFKAKDAPLLPDEIPLERYPNVVTVPLSEEDKAEFQRRLQMLEEEEGKVRSALSDASSNQPKSLPLKRPKASQKQKRP